MRPKEGIAHGKQNLVSLAVFAMCGILAAATVPQVDAQTKDNIPVNPKLSVKPPEGAIVLFGGKAEQMRDNWYARRSTDPAGWTVDDKGVATPNQARHQQQAGVRRLLPARGVLRAAEGRRQQRRRDAGPVRGPDSELLRQEARSPRVRRILQPDAAQGDRLQARRRVADVRHLLPRTAVRRERQGRRERSCHRVPERHPDPPGCGVQRTDRHPVRAVQGRGAEGTDRPSGRPRRRAVPKRVDRAGEVLNRRRS